MINNVEQIDNIQFIKSNDGYKLYNSKNDKLIELTEGDPHDFLSSSQSSKFRNAKYTRLRPFEVVLFGKSVNLSKLNRSMTMINKVLSSTKVIYIALLLQLGTILYLTASVIANAKNISISNQEAAQGYMPILFAVYIIMLLVTMIHEIGHMATYVSATGVNEIFLGIELRYGVLLLFFTSVPFIDELNIKTQINVILAGIKSQLIVGLLPIVLFNFNGLKIFSITLFLVNFIYILSNALPFMKLDGYWAINKWLGVDDYSKIFWQDIKNHKYPGNEIFILNSINIIIIVAVVCSTIKQILEVFR